MSFPPESLEHRGSRSPWGPAVALAVEGSTDTGLLRAVAFRPDQVLDRLTVRLGGTGPGFVEAGALAQLVQGARLIVHGEGDVRERLAVAGLWLPEDACDVEQLGAVLLPGEPDHGLAALVRYLVTDPPVDGADAVRRVYEALVGRARGLSPALLLRLAGYTAFFSAPLARLFAELADAGDRPMGVPGGLDLRDVGRRLERPRPIGAPRVPVPVSGEEIAALLAPDGLLSRHFPGFEARPEQVAMACAVAESLVPSGQEAPQPLLVEGGTGIGKSVAYLLPSVLFALRNNVRVVISTNTIGLQEQLVHKDIPDLLSALAQAPDLGTDRARYAQLKGKANYLCLRRWQQLAASEQQNPDEARLLARTLVWLQETNTGDRAEVSLAGKEAAVWDRISATAFAACPGAREGACFYRHARERSGAVHLLVVNHALLLSDALVEGSLLPEFAYLIVDEAHNLEEEATRQLGFTVSRRTVDDLLERLGGLLQGVASAARITPMADVRRSTLLERVQEAQVGVPRVRGHWEELVRRLASLAAERHAWGGDGQNLRITGASRGAPGWSDAEIVWDNFDRAMGDVGGRVQAVHRALEPLTDAEAPGVLTQAGDLVEWTVRQAEVRDRLRGFVAHPDDTMVYWVGREGEASSANGAPLEVGSRLQDLLFAGKQGVVLTSATLTVDGSFAYVMRRLAFHQPRELALGSPFDYEQAAVVCVPTDVPEPTQRGYAESVAAGVHELALAAGGQTLVLLTSHAAIRAAAQVLRRTLAPSGIALLAQGIDGTPPQLLAQFQADPRAVLLGTASFWEGVDIGNAALKVLVMARLPFGVPTDPVFQARSERYERAFTQFAVPQAVLRFRQGFGRLIRSKRDRGVVVVLDSRVMARSYGRSFLASLPPALTFHGPMAEVAARTRRWLSGT